MAGLDPDAGDSGARAIYLYEGNKDTKPEYIGQAISSGCIRMTNLTNEYVIDLFDRVQQRATVVVLTPGRSAWMGPIAGRS